MHNEVDVFLAGASVSGAPVTRIDTHAASVFLSGDRALKIKRPVKLPFLDFSTLERRKAACEAELAANKPFAPAIYRRIVPVTRESDGNLRIDGPGEPVEWALEMLRFDERATLDKLAERGAIDIPLAAAIADAIAASHAQARIANDAGWTHSIPAIIRQNAEAFRIAGVFPPAAQEELETVSRRAFADHFTTIEQRAARGFVRRCHGDLHLANLALMDGKPALFDALEFDETLATVDILHDLSFALMDLLHYGCLDASNVTLNRYLDLVSRENLGGLGLLPLFISLRAAVRANVLCIRSAQDNNSDKILQRANAYFKLAGAVLAARQPTLIAIGGLSGTGKSAVARRLAPHAGTPIGAIVLRSDAGRKRLFGRPELHRLAIEAYRPDVTARVYADLATEAATVIRQGQTVIVDAVFAREDERTAIERVANAAGVPFIGLFLTADLATRCQRVAGRIGDASDATVDVARTQEEYALGTLDWRIINAAGTLNQTVALCTEVASLSHPTAAG